MKNKSTFLRILILILVLFLLIYHLFKLYNIYFGNDLVNSNEFLKSFQENFPISTIIIIQSALRILITVSLIGIVFRKKIGLLGMWIGIGTLVITQFIIVYNTDNEFINNIHSGIKPIKGLILPIVITYLYKISSK